MEILRKIMSTVLDFLFPREEEVKAIEEMGVLGARRLPPPTKQPSHVTSLFDYRNKTVRKAIWEIKYRGNRTIASIFAAVFFEEMAGELEEEAALRAASLPLLLPIPLSKKRFRERGFNQCELLISLFPQEAKNFFEIRTDILYKIKETKSQTSMRKRKDREENIIGAFAISKPELLKRRAVIIIDDVATTGATLSEARKTLLKNGARQVTAYTLAH